MTIRRASVIDVPALCEDVRNNYSPCDVSDALQILGVPGAGYLADIHPLPSRAGCTSRIVAPIRTVLFVDQTTETHQAGDASELGDTIPPESNLSGRLHWTDAAPPGSVVLMQQPTVANRRRSSAILSQLATKCAPSRVLWSMVVRETTRAVESSLCAAAGEQGAGGAAAAAAAAFQVWSRALTSVGTSLQAKPWAVDVSVRIGLVTVRTGDVIVADEGECVCVVFSRGRS